MRGQSISECVAIFNRLTGDDDASRAGRSCTFRLDSVGIKSGPSFGRCVDARGARGLGRRTVVGGDSVEARATPRRVNRRAGRRGWMLGRAVMVDG